MSDSFLSGIGMDSLAQSKMMEQTRELERLKAQVESAKSAPSAEEEKAAKMFEGLLIKQMLSSMWNTVPEGGMLTGSKEESTYRDMLNDAYAEDLSSGQGIGIKQLILDEFARK